MLPYSCNHFVSSAHKNYRCMVGKTIPQLMTLDEALISSAERLSSVQVCDCKLCWLLAFSFSLLIHRHVLLHEHRPTWMVMILTKIPWTMFGCCTSSSAHSISSNACEDSVLHQPALPPSDRRPKQRLDQLVLLSQTLSPA